MILLFVMVVCSITQLVSGASNLLKLAGLEVYAWDSERKLKIEQMDLSVLDPLKEEFKKNGKDFETIFVKDQKIFVYRGKDKKEKNVIAAFDKNGEALQYSGPMQIKEEGQSAARELLVDLVKNSELNLPNSSKRLEFRQQNPANSY